MLLFTTMSSFIFRCVTVPVAAIALTTLVGCSRPQPVQIPFELTFADQPIKCAAFIAGKVVSLKDFRLYLHDIQLKRPDGDWQSLQLEPTAPFQNSATALLDFENGTGDCDLGTTSMNKTIIGEIPPDDYQAIRFKVGVPFELNHRNPLTAPAPLNDSSMHWHWQAGYKFVRAEFAVNGKTNRLHVGSLQCKGEVDDISHCEQPNRAEITLEGFSLGQSSIKIEVDDLITSLRLGSNEGLTCMGGGDDPWCANALKWIGLTGTQTAFTIAGGK